MKRAPQWLIPDDRGMVGAGGVQGTFNGPSEGESLLGGWVEFDAGGSYIILDGNFTPTMLRELADMMEANQEEPRPHLPREEFLRRQLTAEIEAMLEELGQPALVERIFPNGWRNEPLGQLGGLYDLCLRTFTQREREAAR